MSLIVLQSVKVNFKNEVWFYVKYLSNTESSSPEEIIQYRIYWETALSYRLIKVINSVPCIIPS